MRETFVGHGPPFVCRIDRRERCADAVLRHSAPRSRVAAHLLFARVRGLAWSTPLDADASGARERDDWFNEGSQECAALQ